MFIIRMTLSLATTPGPFDGPMDILVMLYLVCTLNTDYAEVVSSTVEISLCKNTDCKTDLVKYLENGMNYYGCVTKIGTELSTKREVRIKLIRKSLNGNEPLRCFESNWNANVASQPCHAMKDFKFASYSTITQYDVYIVSCDGVDDEFPNGDAPRIQIFGFDVGMPSGASSIPVLFPTQIIKCVPNCKELQPAFTATDGSTYIRIANSSIMVLPTNIQIGVNMTLVKTKCQAGAIFVNLDFDIANNVLERSSKVYYSHLQLAVMNGFTEGVKMLLTLKDWNSDCMVDVNELSLMNKNTVLHIAEERNLGQIKCRLKICVTSIVCLIEYDFIYASWVGEISACAIHRDDSQRRLTDVLYRPKYDRIKRMTGVTINEGSSRSGFNSSVTTNSANNEVMHRECGFIRLKPDKSTIALVIAQNSGITTIEEATITNQKSLSFLSKNIGRISFSKEPSVTQIKRIFTLLDDNKLRQEVWMATSKTKELTEHLKIEYDRVV